MDQRSNRGILLNMPMLELNAKSADGKSIVAVSPYVKPNGDPAVVVIVKKEADGVFDTTLDGQPAIAFLISEDSSGNAAWTLGDLLGLLIRNGGRPESLN